MTLSFVPSQHDAFNDGVAIALARVVRSQLSPAGVERVRGLAAKVGQRVSEITGLITVRHGRLVRPAWHVKTDFGSHYVILINDTEAELYDSKTNKVIACSPASVTHDSWATADHTSRAIG